jgi:hypothetical protein
LNLDFAIERHQLVWMARTDGGPQGVKNVEPLKGLQGTELETLIRLSGPFCSDEFSEFAISILRSGLFGSTL